MDAGIDIRTMLSSTLGVRTMYEEVYIPNADRRISVYELPQHRIIDMSCYNWGNGIPHDVQVPYGFSGQCYSLHWNSRNLVDFGIFGCYSLLCPSDDGPLIESYIRVVFLLDE